MSRDQPPRRSSSRPVDPPRVAIGGPLRRLKQLLHQLYVDAGTPNYEAIAARMETQSNRLGKTAIGRYLRDPELPSDQAATIALAAVLASQGPRDVDDACAEVRRLWTAARDWLPLGTPLAQLGDPFALEVHEAIAVPGHGDLPLLPPYLIREHDHELRQRICEVLDTGRSAMVTLVGESSTGKTRACWEALHTGAPGAELLAGWRVWHPFDPTRPEATLSALKDLDDLAPRTVIWLNEAQLYLLTEGSDLGERVAARLRTVLEDPDRGPLLILGTLWPQYWDSLTRLDNSHPEARELVAGTRISVADSVAEATIEELRAATDQDPRLAEAATRADGGAVIQYLAGAPALLDRFEAAPPAAHALLTAAMDLRRLGHGPAIPQSLLEASTPGYLTNHAWDDLEDDWFGTALSYARHRCHGAHRPLTLIRARPGQPATTQPAYRLADYLDEVGRHRRHREVIPPSVWPELLTHVVNPPDAAALGIAAADRLLYRYALPLLRRSTNTGDNDAAHRLAEVLAAQGDLTAAITVLRAALDNGSRYAAVRLAELLEEQGDTSGAITVLQAMETAGIRHWRTEGLLASLLAAQRDIPGLRVLAGTPRGRQARSLLVDLLAEKRDVEQLRALADDGDRRAAEKLATLLNKHDDTTTPNAEEPPSDEEATDHHLDLDLEHVDQLRTLAAGGDTSAAYWLAKVLAASGDIAAATSVLRDVADSGNEDGALWLAELLTQHGDIPAATTLLRTLAEAGNEHAARQLAEILAEQGATDELRALGEAGDDHAWNLLVDLFADQDALAALRELAITDVGGSSRAEEVLAEILAERGDTTALRDLVNHDCETATYMLARMLAERGDIDQLRDVADTELTFKRITKYRYYGARVLTDLLVKSGDASALRDLASVYFPSAEGRLVDLLADQGDVEELQQEVLRGNPTAAENLSQVLAGLSDRTAEQLRRFGLNADGTVGSEEPEPDKL